MRALRCAARGPGPVPRATGRLGTGMLGTGLLVAGLLGGCAPGAGPSAGREDPAPGSAPPASSATGPSGTAPVGTAPSAGPPSPDGTPTAAAERPRPPELDDPASLSVVVNKRRPLIPPDWAPPVLEDVEGQRLRPEAAAAARGMLAAERADGVRLRIVSGYRSWSEQQETYAGWVARKGPDAADVVSARPGHSEHQTGLAVDVGEGGGCDLQVCFADTAAAAWVAEHGPEHGFVVRYPWGEEGVTGYWYEPWHLRYLGPVRAQELVRSGAATLEQFTGLDPAPDYGAAAPG
ncbi:D-alanyl-D-alanine carboxypeptidase family protein [Kocuria sediminis]|uniref:D-alanyl-D-alanine carboxypeptidase family protein n=1 Tax=Kocuria sediminis TaxID=1038857 RepID=A0A6N8GM62_9MICC|nr:M15 family metallopeptidase [Kocuria sediminis]MUN62363.1 D-alanyl-D-alanine carboxypeptidase family protein [Kocuria sediminis]